MNVTRINIVLALLLFIAVVLTASADVDRSQPNFEFLPQMKRSAASNAWSPSAVFPDRRTMQAPVPGTIPRGELPLHYAATKEDAARAGEDLHNPFTAAVRTIESTAEAHIDTTDSGPDTVAVPEAGSAPDAATVSSSSGSDANLAADDASASGEPDAAARLQASVQRGSDIYSVFCTSCHGPSGAGDGPVAKRGFPPPPPLPTGKSVQMKDGQLFHILSYGQGNMAPMAAQLSRDRRWDVINYVRSLQQGAASPASTESSAASVPEEPAVPLNTPFPAEKSQP